MKIAAKSFSTPILFFMIWGHVLLLKKSFMRIRLSYSAISGFGLWLMRQISQVNKKYFHWINFLTFPNDNFILLSDFSIMIKGSNAGERKGVVYTIGSIDHPLVLLSKSSFRLGLGDVDIVGLKVEQVFVSITNCIILI